MMHHTCICSTSALLEAAHLSAVHVVSFSLFFPSLRWEHIIFIFLFLSSLCCFSSCIQWLVLHVPGLITWDQIFLISQPTQLMLDTDWHQKDWTKYQYCVLLPKLQTCGLHLETTAKGRKNIYTLIELEWNIIQPNGSIDLSKIQGAHYK